MTGVMTMTDANEEVHPPLERALKKTFAVAGVLAVAVVALVIALLASLAAHNASNQALAGCRLYKTVAESPITDQTSGLGLTLAAGARTAYITAQCKLGPLKPIDPRVVPFMPGR